MAKTANYELSVLYLPDTTAAARYDTERDFEDLLISSEDDGIKRLAYSIYDHDVEYTKAHYFYYDLEIPNENTYKGLAHLLNVDGNVLRYLLVRKDKNHQR